MTSRRSRIGRLDLILAIVAAVAALVALLGWGVSSPPGSSPDEDYHLASIWCAQGPETDRCERVSEESRAVPGDVAKAADCFKFLSAQAASCPLEPERMISTTRGNWNGEAYPPGFYAVMGLFVTGDLSQSVVMMRSLNAVVYVGMCVLLVALLPRRIGRPFVWGALLTLIPLGAFLIPSVNPSSWAVISATGLWAAAWGFFETRGARRIALGLVTIGLFVLGAVARADSTVYGIIALGLAAVLAFRNRIGYYLLLLLPAVLFVLGVFLFFSAGQSAIVSLDAAVRDTPLSLSTLLFVDLQLLPQLLVGIFGLWGLGWLDTTLPGIVWIFTLTAFCGVAFWGLRVGGWRKWLAVTLTGAAVVVVPLYTLLRDGVVVGAGVQPRYVYPLIIVFAGVILVGLRRSALGLGRVQLLTIAALLAVANAAALHTNLRRYVTGLDVPNFNLNAGIEWWWGPSLVPPLTLWAAASLAAIVALAVGVVVCWRTVDPAVGESLVAPRASVGTGGSGQASGDPGPGPGRWSETSVPRSRSEARS